MHNDRDLGYLKEILESAKGVQEFMREKSFAEFDRDWASPLAISKCLEIIGEATKKLSLDLRDSHPEVPWRRMAGLREILVHQYNDVSNQRVFNIVKKDLPVLVDSIEDIIRVLENN